MKRLVSAAIMAAMDKDTIEIFGLPGRILMETAGRESGRIIFENFPLRKMSVLVLCGTGNNGGDGWVAARYLLGWNTDIHVLLAGSAEKLSPESRINKSLYEKAGGRVFMAEDEAALKNLEQKLFKADLFVDALFGIGLDRPVQGFYAKLMETVTESGIPVVSLDIPSGIHADTGAIQGMALKASHTITFGFAKPGLLLEPGRSHSGTIHVVDIGIPGIISQKYPCSLEQVTEKWAAAQLPERSAASHKGHFGHILLVGGAPATRGAAVLAATAALRSGCGLISLAVPESSLPLPGMLPEIMVQGLNGNAKGFCKKAAESLIPMLEGKSLAAAGPGMGTGKTAAAILRILLESSLPLVLDADALNLLALHGELMDLLSRKKEACVLTPHPGEMARLCGMSVQAVQEDRISAASNFALEKGCHLLLKGASTVAATPDGICRIITKGNPGMATGGSGDVLCGILAGLMAQGKAADTAAPLAAFLHGMAADHLAEKQGPQGYLPSEVAAVLPEIFKIITTGSQWKP
ncbi:NAD(P)H-hydrate dehydratase [Desulfobotulus mexicanus]|uniref:Bifunctional NAD(P)H-hydrate repair enzyme n=1 Tax=Desulfobotulus mexicanus TaxID=2586642 RepID=A0A5Q4VJ67_9BACT|nr:NAD(P)H-hydrate dehydratase [Desulfobotulus mexicanus]TYT76180.1 NAD(P)H-hydrate dehydratase [Desulfobotulus mexicanus]